MHVFSDGFLDLISGGTSIEGVDAPKSIPVINLHPALPGAFDGANAIQRAYDAFQRGEISHSGVMVHRVVKEVDRGEPVIVREIEMKKEEGMEAFEERLHEVEWEIIVQATRKVLDNMK